MKTRTFVVGGLLVALVFAGVVSQFSFDRPDGLESVAEETGFAASGSEHTLADSPFADYATAGIDNEKVSLAVAGVVGALVTIAVGAGILLAVRDRRGRDPAMV